MALTARRWGLYFVLGGTVICSAVWSYSATSNPEAAARVWWANQFGHANAAILRIADQRLSGASQTLRVLELRDSLLRENPVTHTARIEFDGAWPPAAEAALSAAFDSVVRASPAAPDVDIRLVIVLRGETPSNLHPSGIWFLTPAATDGQTCLVQAYPQRWNVEGLQNADERPPADNRRTVLDMLGPCLFYKAFGRPGPLVEQWLQATGYRFALGDWSDDRGRFEDTAGMAQSATALALLRRLLNIDRPWTPRVSLEDRACAHLPRQCRGLLNVEPSALSTIGRTPFGPRGWRDESEWLMSGLVRAMGFARFQRFWRSPLAPAQAFAETMGMPLEQWTSQWFRARLTRPRFGPVIPATPAVLGLALAALALGAALIHSQRRQVS